MFAVVALHNIMVPVVELAKLVAQSEPSMTNAVIAAKEFDLLSTREHSIDEVIHLLWLLRFSGDLCEDEVVAYLRNELQVLSIRAMLYADQTYFRRMQNIESLTNVDISIVGLLDPSNLLTNIMETELGSRV
jgi:hypothetical protein